MAGSVVGYNFIIQVCFLVAVWQWKLCDNLVVCLGMYLFHHHHKHHHHHHYHHLEQQHRYISISAASVEKALNARLTWRITLCVIRWIAPMLAGYTTESIFVSFEVLTTVLLNIKVL
jgi:hypothetical protein